MIIISNFLLNLNSWPVNFFLFMSLEKILIVTSVLDNYSKSQIHIEYKSHFKIYTFIFE